MQLPGRTFTVLCPNVVQLPQNALYMKADGAKRKKAPALTRKGLISC